MKFEMTMPPSEAGGPSAIIEVEAPNWLAALSRALESVGAEQIPKGKAVAEIKSDGSVKVRNASNGQIFIIRNAPPPPTPARPPAPAPAPPSAQASPPAAEPPLHMATMTYIDAEIVRQNAERVVAGPPARALETPPVSVRSPCLIISRSEIERRLKDRGVDLELVDAVRRPPEAPVATSAPTAPDSGQAVQMVHVVEVEAPARDTLTTLKVDLDALRMAAEGKASTHARVGKAPEGFEWLEGALGPALAGARNTREVGERTLRLALAAVPSSFAAFLLRNSRSGVVSAAAVLGEDAACLMGRPLLNKGGPIAACVTGCLSIALEAAAVEPYTVAMLSEELGMAVRNALLASLTDGSRSRGVLLLGNSLARAAYNATDLGVAAFIAAVSHAELNRVGEA
jgi:hypothetical protein